MMKVSTPLFQLKVLINNKPIQEYRQQQNTFVEGRAGSEFSLELTNLTANRILVHPTVDGLSAMNGKKAKKDDSDQGYILAPYQTENLPGWRLDDEKVAQFFFAGKGSSYAEKTGHGENKGVIACAVWEPASPLGVTTTSWENNEEVVPSAFHVDSVSGDNVDPSYTHKGITRGVTYGAGRGGGMSVNCCATPQPEMSNLGTGFGEAVSHEVQTVHFTPATPQPATVAVIYYDDLKGLRARGLRIGRKRYNKPSLPNPFPKSDQGCTPPNGWRG